MNADLIMRIIFTVGFAAMLIGSAMSPTLQPTFKLILGAGTLLGLVVTWSVD